MVDFSGNEKKALASLLSEPSIRAAAEASGLSESTLYRYLRDDAFRSELQRLRDELLEAVTVSLAAISQDAMDKLAAALALLDDQTRASFEDFITVNDDGTWRLNLKGARDKLHLIKKLAPTRYGTRLELTDSQSAAYNLGRLALAVLEERRRTTELAELTARVSALEEKLKGSK